MKYNHEGKKINDVLGMSKKEYDRLIDKHNDDTYNLIKDYVFEERYSKQVELLLNYLGLEHTPNNFIKVLAVTKACDKEHILFSSKNNE